MEAGRAAGKRLLVAAERPTEDGERPKRSRRCAEPTNSPAVREELSAAAPPRPTASEAEAAELVIAKMRTAEVSPPILTANAPADSAVVACALAIHFGQKFDSDRDAKVQFGVAVTTDVRSRWVNGKIGQLIKAAPRALDDIAYVFGAGPDPAELRRSMRLAEPPAAAAPPAPAASSSNTAADRDADGEEVGGEAGEEAAGPSLDYEESLDLYAELIRKEAAEFQRLKHLKLWSKAQRDHWISLPNPNVTSGDLCPQPNMTVVNRDYRAAQLLPHAAAVISVLQRQLREEKRWPLWRGSWL